MMFSLSAKEIGFLCIILKCALPLQVSDPFERCSKKKIQHEWSLFMEDFSQRGLMKKDADGKHVLDEALADILLCCLCADTIVSIVENELINDAFYICNGRKMLLSRIEIGYELKWVDESSFTEDLLQSLEIEKTAQRVVEKPFSLQLSAAQFEKLLDWYQKGKHETIKKMCLEQAAEYDTCLSVLKDVYSDHCYTVLTERITKPGTIISRFQYNYGVISLAKSVYTEDGDYAVLTQCSSTELLKNLTDFLGV